MRYPNPLTSCLALLGLLMTSAAAVCGAADADVAPGSWLDVRVGDAVADVRARLGDPLRREPVDGAFASRYAVHSLTAYAVLYERADRIIAIRVFARSAGDPVPPVTDPFHVSLGVDYDAVKAARGTPVRNGTEQRNYAAGYDNPDGTRSLYEFASEKVIGIEILMTRENIARLSSTASSSEHSGDSIKQAIVDMQSTTMEATSWEYLYLGYHPCSGDQVWKLATQRLQSEGGRYYDVLDVTCPTSGAHRTLFFDITASFGRF